MRFEYSTATDVGRRRRNNEDAFLALPEVGLFAVADGMGGHNAGEVASAAAIAVLQAHGGKTPFLDVNALNAGVLQANEAVLGLGRADVGMRGLGTTLTVLSLQPSTGLFAQVGDSRLYRLRDGALVQLTRDQTVRQQFLDMGYTEEDLAPMRKGVLYSALGMEGVQVVCEELSASGKDVFLLCSDGVSEELSEIEILQLLMGGDMATRAEAIVDAAVAAGGRDNATAIVVRVTA